MKKEVMKDGNSHKLRLNAEDMRIYELEAGDVVDVEICKVENNGAKKK